MRALSVFVALVFALIGGVSSAVAQQQLLHQERSLYRNIFVTDSGDELCMLFRYPVPLGRESCKLKSDPDKLIFDYTQMMMAGLYANPKPAKLLIIGEGGGTIPTALRWTSRAAASAGGAASSIACRRRSFSTWCWRNPRMRCDCVVRGCRTHAKI